MLVLEDEFLIAMEVEQICQDHGASLVVIKRSLEDVGDAMLTGDFDLAVIDVMLGTEPTLPFARQLSDRNVPFVFASGFPDTQDILAEFPNAVFVSKPYSEKALIDALVAALAKAG